MIYLALGANLGDRQAALAEACRRLADGGAVMVEATSPLYETLAVADEPQPPYVNAVVRGRTDLGPRALLEHCLACERAMGRVRPPGRSKAPRTIDIDVLLHGEVVMSEAGLTLPHPGMLERPFVRIPLADVAAPGLRHPLTGEALDHAAPSADVRRLG